MIKGKEILYIKAAYFHSNIISCFTKIVIFSQKIPVLS